MWQKFDTEEIVQKEFVPPGQTVNGKFYCDVMRQMRENIRRKRPDMVQQILGPATQQRSG
jgi:hypothetical protein